MSSRDLVGGLAGILGGLSMGGLAAWLGRTQARRSGGDSAFDERYYLMRDRAGLTGWLLTLAGMVGMWGLIQFRVVTSAALAVGVLYLFSILAFVTAGIVFRRLS